MSSAMDMDFISFMITIFPYIVVGAVLFVLFLHVRQYLKIRKQNPHMSGWQAFEEHMEHSDEVDGPVGRAFRHGVAYGLKEGAKAIDEAITFSTEMDLVKAGLGLIRTEGDYSIFMDNQGNTYYFDRRTHKLYRK